MKAKRRHKLETNQLAVWLAEAIKVVRPYMTAILGVVLLSAVAVVVLSWWTGQSSARSTTASDALFAAVDNLNPNPADLDKVSQQYAGTDVASWAGAIAADLHLSSGCNELFTNKATANQELRKAVEEYLVVLQQSRVPMVRQRATFGLARAREAQGDLEKALESYEEVVKQWPHGAYASVAKNRMDDLKRGSTRSFYDKFAKFTPGPAFSGEPGTPGQRPAFDLDTLPDNVPSVRPGPLMKLEEKGSGEIKLKGPTPTPPDTKAKDAPGTSPRTTETQPADSKPTVPQGPPAEKPADWKN